MLVNLRREHVVKYTGRKGNNKRIIKNIRMRPKKKKKEKSPPIEILYDIIC